MMIAPQVIARYWVLMLAGVIALLLLSIACALLFGAVPMSPVDILQWAQGETDAQTQLILFDIRLPRILLALCVGALLALCGAVTQGLFRNPLADPSLIGVSAGAAAGAGAVIVLLDHLQWAFWGLSLVSLGAFAGGMVAVLFVYRLATGPMGTSVATMLLAGIAVTFLAGSVSSIFEFLADNTMLKRISLWRMGGLHGADYTRVLIAVCPLIFISWVLMHYYHALNAFLLGESEARHLGIDVHRVKKILIVCVAAGVGVAVAFAGTIAFIGLVVPHMVRFLVGPNHRYLLPLSGALGAILLINADTFARVLLAPAELPVGLVTAIIGAPIFISLLRSRHQYGMR